jgi:hypothetical protein
LTVANHLWLDSLLPLILGKDGERGEEIPYGEEDLILGGIDSQSNARLPDAGFSIVLHREVKSLRAWGTWNY